MKQHRKLACAALPLLVAGVLTTPARADGETLAVFTKNQTNPFFQTVRVGADNMAKALNAKTLHYIPTKPDSIPEQLSQIEDVVVKKPSAIVFRPTSRFEHGLDIEGPEFSQYMREQSPGCPGRRWEIVPTVLRLDTLRHDGV